jgi:hypothetical protein
MSNEANILAKLGRLNMPQQVLAGVLDLGESYLSRGLKGVRPLSGSEVLRIDEVLNNLIDIAQIISPFELPRTNVALLKLLLTSYEDNGLAQLRGVEALADLRSQMAELRHV